MTTFETGDTTEDERERRLRGKRAGKPGKGFAEIREVDDPEYDDLLNTIRILAEKSRRLLQELNCNDNPAQYPLECPTCGLMNDFTANAGQIFFFRSEVHRRRYPKQSTTEKRITVLEDTEERICCKCGNCEEEFVLTMEI